MNPRQQVLVAMFLALAVYVLANARAASIITGIGSLKQVPPATKTPTGTYRGTPPRADQRPSGTTRLA